MNIPQLPYLKFVYKPPLSYIGSHKNGYYHGKGTLNIGNSTYILEGTFFKGMFTAGKVYYPDGVRYEGEIEDQYPCKYGIIHYKGVQFKIDSLYSNSPDFFKGEIIFEDGEVFEGTLNSRDGKFIIEGKYYRVDSFGEKTEIKEIILGLNSQKLDPIDAVINNLPACSYIRTFQMISSQKDEGRGKEIYRVVFNSGDVFEGSYCFRNISTITGKGTIRYHDKRYPDIEVEILNNYPVGGEGILHLPSISTTFEGNFDIGGSFTAIDTLNNTKDEYQRLKRYTWNRKRTYLEDGRTLITVQSPIDCLDSGEGLFKFGDLEVEAVHSEKYFINCKILNTKTGLSYTTDKIREFYNKGELIYNFKQLGNHSNFTPDYPNIESRLSINNSKINAISGKSFTDVYNKFKLIMPPPKMKESNTTITNKYEGVYIETNGRFKQIGVMVIGRFMFFCLSKGLKINNDGTVIEKTSKEGPQQKEKDIFMPCYNRSRSYFDYSSKDYPYRIHFKNSHRTILEYKKGKEYLINSRKSYDLKLGRSNLSNSKQLEGQIRSYSYNHLGFLYDSWSGFLIFGQSEVLSHLTQYEILNFSIFVDKKLSRDYRKGRVIILREDENNLVFYRFKNLGN